MDSKLKNSKVGFQIKKRKGINKDKSVPEQCKVITKTSVKSEPANVQKSAMEIDNEILTKLRHMTFLKSFDLNCSFGPCVGLTRQERIDVARRYTVGSVEMLCRVEGIIRQYPKDPDYRECLWYKILK